MKGDPVFRVNGVKSEVNINQKQKKNGDKILGKVCVSHCLMKLGVVGQDRVGGVWKS